MAETLATSRLTFCTSSSERCGSRSALVCSPRTINSMAAFRRVESASESGLVAFRIIQSAPVGRYSSSSDESDILLANPGPQNLRRNFGFAGDLFAKVLGQDLRGFRNHLGQFERIQGLCLGLLLLGLPR